MQPWPFLYHVGQLCYRVGDEEREEKHVREDETITVGPVGVLGVEVHELVEKNVSDGGHAHGGTGVAGVGLEGGIDLELFISIHFFN